MRPPARPGRRGPSPRAPGPGRPQPRARFPPWREHAFRSSQAGIPLLAGVIASALEPAGRGAGAPSASGERNDLCGTCRDTTESVARSVQYNEFSNAVAPTANVPGVPASSAIEAAHHVLDPGVVLESVHRQVFTVPAVLEA